MASLFDFVVMLDERMATSTMKATTRSCPTAAIP